MSLRLALVLLCLLAAQCRRRAIVSAAGRTNITSLPGLDGALPSRLETGYVTVDEENGAELFYYFIESEGDPGSDPVLLWLNGGSRCSVLSGLFFEIGPVKLVVEPYNGGVPRLRHHPYSWTKFASILFVDSPVGSGFSFSRDPRGYDVSDLSSSLQLTKFLNQWFTEHSEFLANPFYVGGESYAGFIVPFVAQKISEDIEAGVKPALNLKGYLVGNPGTGEKIDEESKIPYAHGVGLISDQLYETVQKHCGREDYVYPQNEICAQALNRCNDLIDEVWSAHILYKKCMYVSPMPDNGTTGGKILEEIEVQNRAPLRPPVDCPIYCDYLIYFWVNSNITRETLGIKMGTVDEWVRCDDDHVLPYSSEIDSSIKYHRNLTSKGYRALVYSGDHDIVAPFLGTQAWVRSLNFSIVDDWRAWHVDGQSAGFTIKYANDLTFATVKGGGHTAPEYQPERCFAMFERWISEKSL